MTTHIGFDNTLFMPRFLLICNDLHINITLSYPKRISDTGLPLQTFQLEKENHFNIFNF